MVALSSRLFRDEFDFSQAPIPDGVELIVREQGGLLGQGGEEEPRLVLSGDDHTVPDYRERLR
jgi:hypothetical protein